MLRLDRRSLSAKLALLLQFLAGFVAVGPQIPIG